MIEATTTGQPTGGLIAFADSSNTMSCTETLPLTRLKTRRLKEAKKLPVFLDQIQAAAFMEAPRSMKGRKNRPCEELILRNLAILEILYGSGMRISALVNLRVTDVDLDMMTIT